MTVIQEEQTPPQPQDSLIPQPQVQPTPPQPPPLPVIPVPSIPLQQRVPPLQLPKKEHQSPVSLIYQQAQPDPQISQEQPHTDEGVKLNFLQRVDQVKPVEATKSDDEDSKLSASEKEQTSPEQSKSIVEQSKTTPPLSGGKLRRSNSDPISERSVSSQPETDNDNESGAFRSPYLFSAEDKSYHIPSPSHRFKGVPPAIGQLLMSSMRPMTDSPNANITATPMMNNEDVDDEQESEFEVSVEFSVKDDLIKHGGTIEADFPLELIKQKIFEQTGLLKGGLGGKVESDPVVVPPLPMSDASGSQSGSQGLKKFGSQTESNLNQAFHILFLRKKNQTSRVRRR
eukprot:TRINITY_DN23560_c0_g3_i2.p1 TRINITY_DN23560_c0_g3~~TRINITY_DN23560_c0_g3_i2.p1  ORF type:complete len:342 (-),score=60.05 TRINITY_DN23560_c0_g3_i2:360-1385(-)